jgi:hypothetical protein
VNVPFWIVSRCVFAQSNAQGSDRNPLAEMGRVDSYSRFILRFSDCLVESSLRDLSATRQIPRTFPTKSKKIFRKEN